MKTKLIEHCFLPFVTDCIGLSISVAKFIKKQCSTLVSLRVQMCLTVLLTWLRFYNVLAQVIVLRLHKKMALLSGSGALSRRVVVKLTTAQELF